VTLDQLYICTREHQLVRIERTNGTWRSEPVLQRMGVQCVAAAGAAVLVGTRESGALLSADAGTTWKQIELPEANVLSVAIGAADGALYAGTEPSRLFVGRDGGSWAELTALQDIPSRDRWSFPPRPWTHHVRWIAPDPHHSERLLVGIELGGLMYTDNGGATFSDHRPGAKRDVHSVAWHPRRDGRAYEAAGDGAAWSSDGGLSWEAADAGRELRYCWALAVDPSDPDCWYVSAASGPGAAHSARSARGRLYRWSGAWEELALPSDTMPYALSVSDGELVAAMADGRVFHSPDRGQTWADTGVDAGPVIAMAARGE
jgi:photosystem II stability/assembly factor-like uncharacterized protein